MKILVTGVSGFIGKRLVVRLLKSNHEVVGTGRGTGNSLPENVRYIAADLCHKDDYKKIFENPIDAVIHCAGRAGAWGSFKDFERANVESTQYLLAASRQNEVKKFINLSSPSIYFDYRDQFDLREDHLPRHFSNAYAETKFQAEKLVKNAHCAEMSTVSLRPRGVIGAGDQNWLPRIIQMRQKNRLVQIGDGRNQVDFTSVENLLDAIELCLTANATAMGRTYNITNGKPEALWHVIENSLTAVGLDGKRRQLPYFLAMAMAKFASAWARLRNQKQEPSLLPIKIGVAAFSMTLDITDARTFLGYTPRVSTSEAIKEFSIWWNEKNSSINQ